MENVFPPRTKKRCPSMPKEIFKLDDFLKLVLRRKGADFYIMVLVSRLET